MNHIQIYKGNYKFVKAFGIFGLVFVIFGLWFLLKHLLFPASRADSFELSLPIVMISQGLLAVNIAFHSLRSRRYFIEWDEEQIRYWQPRRKEPEFINKSEVVSVEINKLDVLIRLKNGEKHFSLKSLYYPERKIIQDMFEELNQKD